MTTAYAWPAKVTEIVDRISDETQLDWDTDSNINILTSFIEEHCSPEAFEKHVRQCAISDETQRDGLGAEIGRFPARPEDAKIDPAFDGGAEQCLTRALMLCPGVAKSFLFEITQALQCVRQAKKKIEIVAPWLDVLPIEYRNKPSFPGNYAKEAMRLLG